MSILASLGLQRSNKLVGNRIKHVGTCLFFEDFFYILHTHYRDLAKLQFELVSEVGGGRERLGLKSSLKMPQLCFHVSRLLYAAFWNTSRITF
jgi:hypothetical protein